MSALRFSLNSADPTRLAAFYRDGLGFRIEAETRRDAAAYGFDGEATIVSLTLGTQRIELVGFDRRGEAYPGGSTSHDGWFQHLALVATDIDAAYARLLERSDWSAISRGDGPVQLPPASGGVRAFKFRDPEGHPLELLAFPPGKAPPPWSGVVGDGPLVGIDHSAIVVSDIDRSIAFYRELGFEVSAQSENVGAGQDALDGADAVRVSVRALSRAGDATPHLELLGYHVPFVRTGQSGFADIACTRSVLDGTGEQIRDPDGHVVIAVRGA